MSLKLGSFPVFYAIFFFFYRPRLNTSIHWIKYFLTNFTNKMTADVHERHPFNINSPKSDKSWLFYYFLLLIIFGLLVVVVQVRMFTHGCCFLMYKILKFLNYFWGGLEEGGGGQAQNKSRVWLAPSPSLQSFGQENTVPPPPPHGKLIPVQYTNGYAAGTTKYLYM